MSRRAAVYIRWSTEDQGEGTTLHVQREACLRYCAEQGWAVAGLYVDDGWSGGTLRRPALNRLRADLAAGRADAVVVYRLDRLSRNLADAAVLIDREWRQTLVRSATEEIRPEADEGWLNYTFRAAFADYERRLIRQRTWSGKLRRAQEGRHIAPPPYGYRRGPQKGTLVIEEGEAAAVRRLFSLCAREELGPVALARRAASEGLPPPRGGAWAESTVRRLLRNPLYAGRLVFGASRLLKRSDEEPGPWRQRRPPLVEAAADPAAVPPVISPDLWEMARAILARRRERVRTLSPRADGGRRLLSGLLRCACGARLTLKPVGQQLYYRCRTGRPCPAGAGYLPAGSLEEAAASALTDRLHAVQQRLAAGLREHGGAAARQLQERLSLLERQAARTAQRLAFLDGQYLDGQISADELRRLRQPLTEEESRLRRQMQDVRQQVTALAGAEGRMGAGAPAGPALVQAAAAAWAASDPERRRRLLTLLVNRVVAFRPREGEQIDLQVEWVATAPVGEAGAQAAPP